MLLHSVAFIYLIKKYYLLTYFYFMNMSFFWSESMYMQHMCALYMRSPEEGKKSPGIVVTDSY